MEQKVYNEVHMKEISALYAGNADKVADVYRLIKRAAEDFQKYYRGNGNQLFSDVVNAYLEHLSALEKCIRKIAKYVEGSYESMRRLDENELARKFSRGSGGRW